ncbi:MAG: hypothetical protein ACLFPD_12115 [Desulfosudaceae bacterium]
MILYLNLCQPFHKANGLKKMIETSLPQNLQALYTLEELGQRIQASTFDIDILIVHVCADSPITQLLDHKDDLKDLSVVLVLHDITSDKHIEKLLQLYPRYMTFGENYNTIISVLKNRLAFREKQAGHNTRIGEAGRTATSKLFES